MREVTPNELQAMIADGTALVVDVREADEFASGHIAGAVNLPLSRFDPAALPDPGGRTLVLNCAGGKRSAMALSKCAVAQAAVAGMGICQLPEFYVLPHIASGALVPLLADFAMEDEPIWAVYPQRRHLLPKITGLLDLLRSELPVALARRD